MNSQTGSKLASWTKSYNDMPSKSKLLLGGGIGATVGVLAGDSEGAVGTLWDGILYGAVGYGGSAIFDEYQKDKLRRKGINVQPDLPNQIADTPSVPETPKVELNKVNPDDLPKVQGANRVTNPKAEPHQGGSVQGSTTAGAIANAVDNDTALDTMNKNKDASLNKVAPEIDKAENKKNMASRVKKDPPPSLVDTQKSTTRATGGFMASRPLAIAGAAIFGAGIVADINNRMTDKRMTERQIRIQEDNLKKQEREEEKAMRKLFGYDYMDYSNIVGELWNNRTGHHKMGNAKFY